MGDRSIMKIDNLLKDLIRVYPIKDYTKYPDMDWNKASEWKSSLLAELDTRLLIDLTNKGNELFGEGSYLLTVGSRFGVGMVSSLDKVSDKAYGVESYFLKTGIMFGQTTTRYEFEINITYHRNGKFINYGNGKAFLKKKAFQFFEYSKKLLMDSFQME
jgi:hypothetical protein